MLYLSPLHSQISRSLSPYSTLFIEDFTRGLRFEPPLYSIAESPALPNILLIGNRLGRIYLSQDQGNSWLENAVLTPRTSFLGSSYPHRLLSFEPLYFLQEGILPSPGQVFSFRDLININQRLPQANGMIRSYFNADLYGNPYTPGFIQPHTRRRASWKLNKAVYSKKGWGLGIHWKSQIAAKSSRQIAVYFIAPHPTKPNEILAATQNGLYHSKDLGDSWPLTLSGVDPSARQMNFIRFHPENSQEIWVGSNKGLWISKDGGETYQIHPNPFLISSGIKWITFNPQNSKEIYVGLNWALLKSTDGGKKFSIVFIHQWPALSHINQVFVDPQRSQVVLIGTQDGLMLSQNGGKSFERAGGLLFMGQSIVSIVGGQRQGHYLVATKDDLWQTFDYGQSWQVAYFGQINWDIRRVVASIHQQNVFWIITSAEILKMSFNPKETQVDDVYSQIKNALDHEPSLKQAIQAGLKAFGIERQKRLALRRKARWSALLPIVDVGLAYRTLPVNFQLANYLILDRGLTNENDSNFTHQAFGAFAWWDLHKLIFNYGELPQGRGEHITRQLEYKIRSTITNLYQERRSLLESMIAFPKHGRAKLMQELRLEELTAHLNQLTQDLFRPFSLFKQGMLSW